MPPRSPLRISFDGETLEVSAVLDNAAAVDRLIEALEVSKCLWPPPTSLVVRDRAGAIEKQ